MATFSDLLLLLKGDTSDIDGKLKKTQTEVATFGRRVGEIGSSLSSIGSKLTTSITLPLVGFGAAALASRGKMDQLERGLAAVAGSADEASRQLVQLREVAKLPGLGLSEAVQGSISLQALGFSAAKARDILLTFGNALATVGRGREDLSEVIRQLGQLGARGQVTADNLKPIIERVPQVAAIIKKNFGPEAIGDPARTFERLGVSSTQFIDVILRELGKLPKVTGGIRNDFENFKDTAEISLAKVGKALEPVASRLLDFAVKGAENLGKIGDAFTELPKPIQDTTIALGVLAASSGVALFIGGQFAGAIANVTALLTQLSKLGIGVQLAKLAGGISLVGTAAVAAGAGVFYAGSKLIEYGAHADTETPKVRKLVESIDAVHGSAKPIPNDTIGSLLSYTATLKDTGNAAKGAGDEHANAAPKIETFRGLIKKADLATYNHGIQTAVQEVIKARDAHQEWGVKLAYVKSQTTDVLPLTLDQAAALARLGGSIGQVTGAFDLASVAAGGFRESVSSALADRGSLIASLPASLRLANAVAQDFDRDLSKVDKGLVGMLEKLPQVGSTAAATINRNTGAIRDLGRQVSTVLTDMSRGIATVIVQGGKMGDVFKRTAQEIQVALIRSVLENGINRIVKEIDTHLLPKLGGIGKVLGGVFGSNVPGLNGSIATPPFFGGGNAGVSATGAAGSPLGGFGGAGTGASGALGTATAVIGAAGAVVGAISSVVGNFQMAHMNTALGRIEESTRFLKIGVLEGEQGILPNVYRIWQLSNEATKAFWNFTVPTMTRQLTQLELIAQKGGGGQTFTGPVTVQVIASPDPRETAKAVGEYLRGLGGRFQAA